MLVVDSGYDLPQLAWLPRDLPVEVAGRVYGDPGHAPAGLALSRRRAHDDQRGQDQEVLPWTPPGRARPGRAITAGPGTAMQ